MSKVISCLAYIAALLCIIVAVATFIGNGFFAEKIVDLTGIRVSPVFSGGDVKQTLMLKGYEVKIHEPVFQGLFSSRKNGFVQVDFVGDEIPSTIVAEVDYDNDGKKDLLLIRVNTSNPGIMVSVRIYDIRGKLVRIITDRSFIGNKSLFVWDGTNDNRQIVTMGYYLILVDGNDADGNRSKVKKTVVVAHALN